MQKLKSKCFLFISPLIVIAVMCVIYALFGIYPFGTKTVSWLDLNQQSIPLLMNLKDILDGKSSILYTISSGGGMNFWGIFLFFLASPFYIAVKFVEKQDMIYFVNILLALKLAVCAFTATLYFSLSFKRLPKVYTVFFGLIYAFCGFGLMYYQTLVWLDTLYLFPLLVLSLETLCRQKKCAFYIILLSISATVNYYLSIMTVIYILISVPLFIQIRCRKSDRKEVAAKFVFSSLSAALITAPVWLCSMLQVQKSARSMNNLEHLIRNNPFKATDDKLAVIMTSAFVFAALLFVIKNKLLKKKRLKYNLILLLFLMIPVFIDPVNKMWHGGGYSGFPLRYGYIIVFTLISVSAELFGGVPKRVKSSKSYTAVCFAILAVLSFTAVFVTVNKSSLISVYVQTMWVKDGMFEAIFGLFVLFFMAYVLFILLYRRKLISHNVFALLISGVFITELFVNLSAYVGYASSEQEIFGTTMALENRIPDEGLYRVKSEKKYTHVNMIGALGLKSYSHYTSLTPMDYLFAMKKMGYSAYWMEVQPNGGTVLTDALLAIKYSIGKDSDFLSYQKNLNTGTKLGAAENTVCAPAGIISGLDPSLAENLKFTDRYDIQRQLAERFFGNDNMLKKYEYTSIRDGSFLFSDGMYTITADEPYLGRCKINYNIDIKGHQVLYFDLFNEFSNRSEEPINSSVKVSVNGIEITEAYPTRTNSGLLNLGEFEDETVDICITLLKDIHVCSFGVMGVDINRLESAVSQLKTVEPAINGRTITAECTAKSNEFLYLAVPWDSGFSAYLNGRETTLYKVNDCFSAVRLDNGDNRIKLVFCPDGLKAALVLTAAGIASAVLICCKKRITENAVIGKISAVICKTGIITVAAVIYIVPVVIYIAGLIFRSGV